ncbi:MULTISPECIES: hypothetical protein [unclassified Tatumella]|uniref:hypothetical protein n=1 Tax=unclassified Tatumella TaxID=2649542 RepID=UPI001BAFCCAD|nr:MULTISPECIES: hypothetical protein [unclassified Tatumella]MBS0878860.1 hypothetical protein [Tatumella sp. JGM82]MBS0892369.1 hypothetical protein [Tatumella sp. JGM94]MBS0903458.1 hypothetical protein [Tatumella sp. JGM100]
MAVTNLTNLNDPTTLMAVNEIIGSIGESQLDSIDTENVDAVNAVRILEKQSRIVQSKGYTFNTELLTLKPDSKSNQIRYSTYWIKVTDPFHQTNYINKNSLLHDRVNQTDIFDNDITLEIIAFRPLNELPDCFLNYIIARSVRQFNSSYFGDNNIDSIYQGIESEMKIECFNYDMDYSDFNMIYDNPFTASRAYRR